MNKKLKLSIAIGALAAFLLSALSTSAYPPFVRKAEKFGAKDCLFCHTEPNGGEGWNERGKFLIAEKDKRKADSIDVEWLTDYKSDAEKKDATGETKEGEKKTDDPATTPTKPEDNKDKDTDKDKNKDKDKDKSKPKKKDN